METTSSSDSPDQRDRSVDLGIDIIQRLIQIPVVPPADELELRQTIDEQEKLLGIDRSPDIPPGKRIGLAMIIDFENKRFLKELFDKIDISR